MSGYNSSYLYGEDVISGWGGRYFFSFYTELGEGKDSIALETSIFAGIFAASVVANLAIAFVLLKYPEMRTVSNCFLLNLTAADLAFVAGVPALIYVRIKKYWTFGNAVCKLLPYSQFVCGFVLLWTLTWISRDRYRCIAVPPFRSQLTPRLATMLTAVTWIVALFLFFPVFLWFRVQEVEDHQEICTLVFPRNNFLNVSVVFTSLTLLLGSILPLSLFVYHYHQIFHKLKQTRDRWRRNDREGTLNFRKPDVLRQQEESRVKRHVRVIRILLLNVMVVLLMWLPITATMFLIYIDGRRPTEDTRFFLRSHHFIWALLIALLNTVVNPILYGVLSENFRKVFFRLWFLSKRKKAVCKEVYDGPAVIATSSSFPKAPMQYTNSISIVD